MGRNADPLPDECDFCYQALDEDEELVPVWTGDPPEPRPKSVQEIVDKPKRLADGGPFMHSELTVLGKRGSEIKALLAALEAHEWVEFSSSPVVEEVTPAEVYDSPVPVNEFEVERRRGKAGATVRVEPEYRHREPDLLVCELCEEAFT